jgi:ABC-2 type transport system ATP-binding protein
MVDNAVEIKDLNKSFGDFHAVNGISFNIKKGEIFGLLGPNGAGKTTTLNMILGILTPSSGRITIEGLDSDRNAVKIKQMIGFMTQETVVENQLTGRDNLRLFARLYHVPEEEIPGRIEESLKEAALVDFGDARAGTYSGGMQRRLSLVRSMIQEPRILILDEPTTGLDVQSRVSMWKHITSLHERGITVILTTQYLEEADALCDRIAVIDHGEIKAIGTASELKRMAAEGNMLEITVKENEVEKVNKMIRSKFHIETEVDGDKIIAKIEKRPLGTSIKIAQMLEKEGSDVLAFSMHLPTLDDAFLKLTGESLRDAVSKDNADGRAAMYRGNR